MNRLLKLGSEGARRCRSSAEPDGDCARAQVSLNFGCAVDVVCAHYRSPDSLGIWLDSTHPLHALMSGITLETQ